MSWDKRQRWVRQRRHSWTLFTGQASLLAYPLTVLQRRGGAVSPGGHITAGIRGWTLQKGRERRCDRNSELPCY